jgi:hypothetical protein
VFDVEITKRRKITKNRNYEKPKLRKIEVCKKTHRQWTVGQMEKNTLFFLSLFCKGDNESTYISFGSTATVQTVLLKNANRYLVVLSFSSPKKESTSWENKHQGSTISSRPYPAGIAQPNVSVRFLSKTKIHAVSPPETKNISSNQPR